MRETQGSILRIYHDTAVVVCIYACVRLMLLVCADCQNKQKIKKIKSTRREVG